MTVTPHLSRTLNAIGLLAVSGVLIAAYGYQFVLDELPCPLCLLQRVALVAVGYGLSLNLIFGARPRHYGIMIIAALYGGSVSGRQILLHIIPGTGSYGSAFLGLHFYTWALICFFLVVVGSAVMLLFEGQFERSADTPPPNRFGDNRFIVVLAFFLMLGLAIANAVTTFLECGPTVCADSPTEYRLL